MLSVIKEYGAIKDNIGHILKASGYRNDYLAAKIGITPQNFAVKKRRGNWNEKELARLVEVITEPNEDAEEAIMLEIMRCREGEDIIPISKMRKELGWK